MSLTSTAPIVSIALAAVLLAAPANADGDAAKGKKVFNKCKACHNVDSEKNKVGPHLVGLFGRQAGSLEGYSYSDAMASSEIVWSAETLAVYIAKPKESVPGTKMAFVGLKKDDEIANITAYLKQFQTDGTTAQTE